MNEEGQREAASATNSSARFATSAPAAISFSQVLDSRPSVRSKTMLVLLLAIKLHSPCALYAWRRSICHVVRPSRRACTCSAAHALSQATTPTSRSNAIGTSPIATRRRDARHAEKILRSIRLSAFVVLKRHQAPVPLLAPPLRRRRPLLRRREQPKRLNREQLHFVLPRITPHDSPQRARLRISARCYSHRESSSSAQNITHFSRRERWAILRKRRGVCG